MSKSFMKTALTRCLDLKKKYPNSIILLEAGNFFFAYREDAAVVSKVLGTTLSKSFQTNSTYTIFQSTRLNENIEKLIKAGHRVAVCSKLQPPRK